MTVTNVVPCLDISWSAHFQPYATANNLGKASSGAWLMQPSRRSKGLRLPWKSALVKSVFVSGICFWEQIWIAQQEVSEKLPAELNGPLSHPHLT